MPSVPKVDRGRRSRKGTSQYPYTHTGIEPSTSHTISLMAAWRHGMECMGLWADAAANADQEKVVSAAAAAAAASAYWKELASFSAARCLGTAWNALLLATVLASDLHM